MKNKQTIGIGAGQMSRVSSAEIAKLKAQARFPWLSNKLLKLLMEPKDRDQYFEIIKGFCCRLKTTLGAKFQKTLECDSHFVSLNWVRF